MLSTCACSDTRPRKNLLWATFRRGKVRSSKVDAEFFLSVFIFVTCSAAFAVLVIRRLGEMYRDDVERAKQILRRLPIERIVDDPRILSQPEIPEQILSFITARRIRGILSRDPINEVTILPFIQQPDEKRISRVGANALAALFINALLWEIWFTLIGEVSAIIGLVFFCVSVFAYLLWRTRKSNFESRGKAERLLRRMTRSEITEVLQLAKIRMETPDKRTDKTPFSPPIR